MENDTKLKLAYCIPSVSMIGGGQRILTTKANYFVEHFGYEVHIIITDEGYKEPYFKLHPSIQVHDLDLNYVRSMPLYRRFFYYFYKRYLHQKRLNKCLNAIKPDITILMVRRELGFIARMTDGSIKIAENHLEKNKYLNDANGMLQRYCPAFLWDWRKKSTLKHLKDLQKFIVLTYEDEAQWTELSNVAVRPNPLTFLPSLQSDCTSKQLIAVGRHVPQKGFDLLIEAWKEVAVCHPDYVLRIYGDGPLRNTLQQQIIDASLTNSCILEYSTQDIAQKYAESSIFVLSSRFEGFGLVIVEAMVCGLPVVSFACPCGPKDIITDGQDGFLVPNGDTKGLARRISYLIEQEEERKQMGQRALLKAQNYRIENIALSWKALFDELIQSRKKI